MPNDLRYITGLILNCLKIRKFFNPKNREHGFVLFIGFDAYGNTFFITGLRK
jgi:hypothetical protein